jgi:hypothetical protein
MRGTNLRSSQRDDDLDVCDEQHCSPDASTADAGDTQGQVVTRIDETQERVLQGAGKPPQTLPARLEGVQKNESIAKGLSREQLLSSAPMC